jgi:peptide subunit release factor 1 (eRF1)
MGTFRSLRRKLNAEKVWIAQEVAEKRKEIEKMLVEERVKKDVEFAKDVLKAVGDNLPEHIKKTAEETIENSKTEPSVIQPLVESQAKELLIDGTLAKLTNDAIKGKLQVNPNMKTNPGRIYSYPLKNP